VSVARITVCAVLAIAAGAAAAFSIGSETLLSLFSQATVYAVFALGVGLLLRQNGMVSFGHAAFYGGAGYIIGLLLETKAAPAEAAILIAVTVIAIFAFLLGLVIVRVPGIAFGMLTLAVGQMFYVMAARSRGLTGGDDGLNIDWPNRLFGAPLSTLLKPSFMFLTSWCVLILILWAVAVLLTCRFGAITEAVRDNEERARFIGVRTLVPRAAVFALSAAIVAVAGVLSALNTGFVSPDSLHWSVSGMTLMMVVVGGYRTLWGPPLGAVVYFVVKDILGDFANHWMGIFGVTLIAVVAFAPDGVAGALVRLAPWRAHDRGSPAKSRFPVSATPR